MEKAVASSTSNTIRYERKFIYNDITPEDLIATQVLTNQFCFREIFHRRTVNNIYYDDYAMSFYHQNVAGDMYRDKYRLRWYGDHFNDIQNPTLEIKKKIGSVGDKLSFKLLDFKHRLDLHTLDQTQSIIIKELEKPTTLEIASKLKLLSPSLYNSYERRYFLSNCQKFRITIDYSMKFYNPKFKDYTVSESNIPSIVLELKYNTSDDKDARKLTQQLNARLSKNSKYVTGIHLINHQKDI